MVGPPVEVTGGGGGATTAGEQEIQQWRVVEGGAGTTGINSNKSRSIGTGGPSGGTFKIYWWWRKRRLDQSSPFAGDQAEEELGNGSVPSAGTDNTGGGGGGQWLEVWYGKLAGDQGSSIIV